jgi:CheY-like chemotaxis protein
MSEQHSSVKKVLFVDDNLQFLEMIQRVMGEWSKGEWEIFLAQNSGKALLLLQEHAMDLVVVDIQMPVVDGIQFLALLHRKYPSVQKVTLSAYADEASRTACLNHGAELFLEKPRNPGDLEIIFSTLRELARSKPVTSGFRGVLRQVSLEDVIQMECLNRNSSVLEVATGKWEGKIYVKEGAIIHAEVGDRNGEAAFNKILSLKGGEFNLRPFTEPPQSSIDGSWEFLLMEAARARDEAGEAQPHEETPTEPPIQAAPPLPKPAPPTRAPTLPPAPAIFVPGQAVSCAARIDEMLVCSAKGEIVYQWKCAATGDRISFLEFLSQKSSQLSEGLNLGMFDRLEMEGERHRIVAQVKPDRGLFVRAAKGQAGSAAETPVSES